MEKLNQRLMIILLIVFVISSLSITTWCAVDALDRNIFPGCKVMDQTDDILTIRLNPELATGTDMANLEAARLIERICSAGYRVRIWDEIIDLPIARELVRLNGAPAPK